MHSHLSNKSGAVSWCCISCRVQTPAKYLMLGGGNPLIVVGPCKSRQLQLILVLLSIFSKVLEGILAILVLYLDDNNYYSGPIFKILLCQKAHDELD